jgi:hypothetical protein
MLAILMLLAMAISGGLFAGTILHSVNQKAQFDQVLDVYQSFWT